MTTTASIPLPTRTAPGRFTFEVPEGWQQGRGCFGGLVAASLVEAIEAESPSPRNPIRSITMMLPAATLPGAAELAIEVIRAGSGVATLGARLHQGGETRAHAIAVVGRTRGQDAPTLGLPPPSPPAWRSLAPFALFAGAPQFSAHFDYLNVGPPPFGAEPDAVVAGWIRLRDPGSLGATARIAATADAWWPACFTRLGAPRPIGTLSYTLHVVAELDGLDPTAPVFHRARELASGDGYSGELRELWSEDGRLLALNWQTVALI